MKGKDQVEAEKTAQDPKKMANLDKESTTGGPRGEDTVGNSGTQGIKGEEKLDENIGTAVKNKSVG